MNKKGEIDGFQIILIIMVLFFTLIVLPFTIYDVHLKDESRDEACKDLGFKEYQYKQSMRYCEDYYGNLHYIKMECPDLMLLTKEECKAKEISVGDVRVLEGRE